MEAFHYRYHPLAERMREIVAGGTLGAVERIETWMCVPVPLPRDIRYRYELAGGATMDVGSYAIHMLRLLAGGEPVVTYARAKLASAKVDRAMTAELDLPGGAKGRIHCSLWSRTLLRIGAHVRGSRGELRVVNPVLPQFYHRLELRDGSGRRREKVAGEGTYTCQLRAFAAAVLDGKPTLTPPEESLANMRVIDDVYRKAGLPLRGL
jgi:predicted dehydrogenase